MDIKRFNELGRLIAPKQRRFLELYQLTGDAVESLVNAGYNVGTGHKQTSFIWNLLNQERSIEYLKLLSDYARGRNMITAQMLVDEFKQIAFFDAATVLTEDGEIDMKAVRKRGKIVKKLKITKRTIKGVTTETIDLEFHSKLDAGEKLAKHIGFYKEDNEQKAIEGVQFYLPDNNRPDSSLDTEDSVS